MKKIPFSLFKYLTLFGALIFTVSALLSFVPEGEGLLVSQIILGLLFLSFSIADFSSRIIQSTQAVQKYNYLPISLISWQAIRTGAGIMAATLLLMAGNKMSYLGSLLVLVLFTDVLIFALSIGFKVFYIRIFANYIRISLERETVIYASQLKEVEYRYHTFFLKLKNNKVMTIDEGRMKLVDRENFKEKFVLWMLCNRISLTTEARQALSEYLEGMDNEEGRVKSKS